jgi:hypothetical protein
MFPNEILVKIYVIGMLENLSSLMAWQEKSLAKNAIDASG